MDFINDLKVEKVAGSKVTISGEIPYTELEKQRQKAIATISKNIKVDGFRPGHIPESIVVKNVGEMTILNEMAERALATVYPEIIKKHQLDVIGSPSVSINKLAPQNPLGFSISVAVIPEITLPDYKKVATKINKEKVSTEVTDEELDKEIKNILRQKIAYERLQKKANSGQKHTHADGSVHDGPAHGDGTVDLPTPESEAEKHSDEDLDPEKIEVPDLTDEYVKSLGQPGQFENVEDFKTKIREHLNIEKTREVNASHRAKITDSIIDQSQIELPQIMIDSEMQQMFAQMEEDLKRANLKMDDYLSHIKKTRDDLVKDWTPSAEKRAKLQLILNEIAKKEDVKPDQTQLEDQVKQLLEQYKDADPLRVRIYVASVMQNEAVMQLLENQ